jgi:hypothetical protein
MPRQIGIYTTWIFKGVAIDGTEEIWADQFKLVGCYSDLINSRAQLRWDENIIS